jgi:hypothetical protein
MPREALSAVLLRLTHLNDRLHLAAEEALELVATDSSLVHLEQRRVEADQPPAWIPYQEAAALAGLCRREITPARLFNDPASDLPTTARGHPSTSLSSPRLAALGGRAGRRALPLAAR